jgi:YegS/Rv2252/BmrU family lipid kinase
VRLLAAVPITSLLYINPGARKGDGAIAHVAALLRDRGVNVEPLETDDPDAVSELIRSRAGAADSVIVGGGDGTLNAAIAGVLDTRLPLGVLPLGTANNLARTLELPTSLEGACDVIARGVTRRIDVGAVNDAHFLTTASLGLSVAVAEELSSEHKQRWGTLSYAVTAARTLSRQPPFRAEIAWPGGSMRTRTVQIVVGNGRYYGGKLQVAEDATIDDRRLDLYTIELAHWWQLLRLAPAMRRGTHAEKDGVRALRAPWFEVRTASRHPVNVDGEIRTHTPARFSVLPAAIEVFGQVPDRA